MRYAEVKVDLFKVPAEYRNKINKDVISRNELYEIFRPIVRARRRGHYDESRGILITIEPRQVIEVPKEFIRYLGD